MSVAIPSIARNERVMPADYFEARAEHDYVHARVVDMLLATGDPRLFAGQYTKAQQLLWRVSKSFTTRWRVPVQTRLAQSTQAWSSMRARLSSTSRLSPRT